jgi:hypothetical protein
MKHTRVEQQNWSEGFTYGRREKSVWRIWLGELWWNRPKNWIMAVIKF